MTLSDDDHLAMTVPAWRRAQMAIEDGEARCRSSGHRGGSHPQPVAAGLLDQLDHVAALLHRSRARRGGRRAGAAYDGGGVHPGAVGPTDQWWALDAEVRAHAIATAMVANGSECEVDEVDDEIVLSFRCGSGGKLIDEGSYEDPEHPGDGYLVLREPGPRTFGRDEMPVYCAHCSINNVDPAHRVGRAPGDHRVASGASGGPMRAPRVPPPQRHPCRGLRPPGGRAAADPGPHRRGSQVDALGEDAERSLPRHAVRKDGEVVRARARRAPGRPRRWRS